MNANNIGFDVRVKSLVTFCRRFKPWLAVAIVMVVALASDHVMAEEPTREALLLVSKITANREDNETHFSMAVKLVNATGEDLTVRTTFNTVFDGLVLEVTGKHRKVLARQPYTAQQSPRQPSGIELSLKQGVTKGELEFSISDLPKDAKTVRVRLIGSLPGHEDKIVLTTTPIKVRIATDRHP